MPVTSGDFLYNYFIYNMSIQESKQPYQYTLFKHSQLITESISENYIIVHLVVGTRQTIELNRIKSCKQQKITAECCGDFDSICFICNMRMKNSRQPYQYTNQKHSQFIRESINENYIVLLPVVWTRQAIEFDSMKSCYTLEKSADLPHMEHIASTAVNDLIPTPYELLYNCGKFKLEYVSNRISFKLQQDAQFLEYCRAQCVTFSSGFNTRLTVAKETNQRYAMPIIFHAKDITSSYRNQSISSSQTDFAGYLDAFATCIGAICGLISNCHGNKVADVTNNHTQIIQLNMYSLHYGIMYDIDSEYKLES